MSGCIIEMQAEAEPKHLSKFRDEVRLSIGTSVLKEVQIVVSGQPMDTCGATLVLVMIVLFFIFYVFSYVSNSMG